MNWREDPSTTFSRKKNVAVEPNITNLQSTIKRESTLNPDKRTSKEREREPGQSKLEESSIRSDLPPRVDPSFHIRLGNTKLNEII